MTRFLLSIGARRIASGIACVCVGGWVLVYLPVTSHIPHLDLCLVCVWFGIQAAVLGISGAYQSTTASVTCMKCMVVHHVYSVYVCGDELFCMHECILCGPVCLTISATGCHTASACKQPNNYCGTGLQPLCKHLSFMQPGVVHRHCLPVLPPQLTGLLLCSSGP